MECMKCGRETSGREVFCEECLKVMEKHPVGSAPVQIHPRPETKAKSAVRKQPKAEELLEKSRKTVARLKKLCLVLTLLLVLALGALGYLIWQSGEDINLGSNYSTATSETGGNP